MKINFTTIQEQLVIAKKQHSQYIESVDFFKANNMAQFYDKFPIISEPKPLRFCLNVIETHLKTIEADAFTPHGESYGFGELICAMQDKELQTIESQLAFINELVESINNAEGMGAHAQYMAAVNFIMPHLNPDHFYC